MGIYIGVFWLLLVIFFIVYIMSILSKFKKLKKILDENTGLFFITLGAFLAMAIITKDPVNLLGINIPTEVQWLSSLLAFGFGSWKFYLSPLKRKVYRMDRELGELKVSINKVESNVSIILNKIIKEK